MPELGQYRPDGREGAYDSDRWWPAGLPEWIGKQVETGDEVLIALDKPTVAGRRSGSPAATSTPAPRLTT
jgi:predicted RNase H-like nuclease